MRIATEILKSQYTEVKQDGLDKIMIEPDDIYPLIESLDERYLVTQLGESYLKRPIYQISTGNGPLRVLMWSQMHGDEPTATAAIFDLLNFLAHPENAEIRAYWDQRITLKIIPMVNPDGAVNQTRYNAQSIDLNRDAVALHSSEARILNKAADDFMPDIGFNLHDQSRFYTVEGSNKPATISLLAPAFNASLDVNDTRLRAMQLIALMNTTIQTEISGCVGRYDDAYSYRCFGDSFAAKGISTILIESGHYPDDPHRQTARWLNFLMLIQAVHAFTNGDYKDYRIADYEKIPMNHGDGNVDILLKNVNVADQFCVDYTINADRIFKNAFVDEVGDMSHQSGHTVRDMSDYILQPLKGYKVSGQLQLDEQTYLRLLREGYSYFIGNASDLENVSSLPLHIVDNELEQQIPVRQKPVHMVFNKEGQPALALILGEWIELLD